MSIYTHVRAAEAPCSRCFAPIRFAHGIVAFQWGYCPSRVPWDDLFYDLGDPIRWRLDDAGRIPPWTYFEGPLHGGNVGDPSVTDLLVRGLDLSGSDLACDHCGPVGLAIRVERGILAGFAPAPPGCDLAAIDAGGHLVPHPEWDDHTMPTIQPIQSSKRLATGDGTILPGMLAP